MMDNCIFLENKFVYIPEIHYLCGVFRMKPMNYLSFREKILPLGCVNTEQINLFFPSYDRNSITRWVAAGRLIKLRRGWYALAEAATERDFSCYVAGRMVSPAYLSMQWALSYYGMIPEMIVSFTSVTTQKPQRYDNDLGTFVYQCIAPHLFFGYEPKSISGGRTYMLATPEKALLDLLYLHPEYRSEEDMLELRLDEDYLENELNFNRLGDYLREWDSPTLTTRVQTLLRAYQLPTL